MARKGPNDNAHGVIENWWGLAIDWLAHLPSLRLRQQRRRTRAGKTRASSSASALARPFVWSRDHGEDAARERRHQICLARGQVSEADASNATAGKEERQSSATAEFGAAEAELGDQRGASTPAGVGRRPLAPAMRRVQSVDKTGTGATGRPLPTVPGAAEAVGRTAAQDLLIFGARQGPGRP